jgi:hypothetical protein
MVEAPHNANKAISTLWMGDQLMWSAPFSFNRWLPHSEEAFTGPGIYCCSHHSSSNANVGKRCFHLATNCMHPLQSKLNSRGKLCALNWLYTIWDTRLPSEWIKIKIPCEYSETFSEGKKKKKKKSQCHKNVKLTFLFMEHRAKIMEP